MEKVTNSLIQTEKKESFSTFMMKPAIQNRLRAMMSGSKGNQFVTSITSAVTANPALQECDPMSVFSSALLGASLDLSPSPQLGQFYMVPFNNRKENKKDAQFILGYKGYIQLAIRSGQYKKINVLDIKEGELIDWNPLTEDIKVNIIPDETERENAKTIGYYAMFEYLNGFRKAMYWSLEKMQLHADKYSKAFDLSVYKKIEAGESVKDAWKYSGFWYKGFDEMGLKTMIRQLISKWGIMSVDMQKAFESDNEEPAQEQDQKEIIQTTEQSENYDFFNN